MAVKTLAEQVKNSYLTGKVPLFELEDTNFEFSEQGLKDFVLTYAEPKGGGSDGGFNPDGVLWQGSLFAPVTETITPPSDANEAYRWVPVSENDPKRSSILSNYKVDHITYLYLKDDTFCVRIQWEDTQNRYILIPKNMVLDGVVSFGGYGGGLPDAPGKSQQFYFFTLPDDFTLVGEISWTMDISTPPPNWGAEG